jgi:hypothetical protein
MNESKNISYSAVVLDEESALRLKQEYGNVPENWRWIAHHMTICMGPLPEDMKELIGQEYSIVTSQLGRSETAYAVMVNDNGLSKNKIPHVTLAVSPEGKPVQSNYIEKWQPIANRIRLTGVITEIPRK